VAVQRKVRGRGGAIVAGPIQRGRMALHRRGLGNRVTRGGDRPGGPASEPQACAAAGGGRQATAARPLARHL
jgi:hypothetical protein